MTLLRSLALAAGLTTLTLVACSSDDDDGTTGTTRVEYLVRDGLPTNSTLLSAVIDADGTPVGAFDQATYHYDFAAKTWTQEGPNNGNGLRRDLKGNLFGWYATTTNRGERLGTALNTRPRGSTTWSTLPTLPIPLADVSDIASDGTTVFVLALDNTNGPSTRVLFQLDPAATGWRQAVVPSSRVDLEHILRADRAGNGVWVSVNRDAVYRKSLASDTVEKVIALDVEPYGDISGFDTAPGGGGYFVAAKQVYRLAPGGTTFEKVDGPPANPNVAAGRMGLAFFDDSGNFTSDLYHGNNVSTPRRTLYRKAGGTGSWRYVAEYGSEFQSPVFGPDGHVFLVGYIGRGTWTLSRQL